MQILLIGFCDSWMDYVLQMKVKSCAPHVLSSVCFGGFYFLPNNLLTVHVFTDTQRDDVFFFLQTAMAVPDPLFSQVIDLSSSSSPGHGI